MNTEEDSNALGAEKEGALRKELYAYQKEGARALLQRRRCILGDRMGMGKTLQIIEACAPARRVLVTCPSTVRGVWKAEIEKWTGEGPGSVVVVVEPEDALLVTPSTRWLIVNYDALRVVRSDGRARPVTKAGRSVFKFKPDTLVIDEAHEIANHTTQAYKGALLIAKQAERVYLATGSPMDVVADWWPLLHLLYPERYRSRWAFLKKHASARPGLYGWVYDERPTNASALAEELRPYFIRREPPRSMQSTTSTVWLEETPTQKSYRKEIEQELIAIIDDHLLFVQQAITKLLRLQQLAIDPRLIGAGEAGLKVPYVVDFVKNRAHKVVVFTTFSQAARLVSAEMDAAGIKHALLTGDQPHSERDGLVAQFQTDASMRAFVATIKVGGPGISLTAASAVLFLNAHYSPSANAQAVARVLRHGQTKPVDVVHLRTKSPSEDHVYATLERKDHNIRSVLDLAKTYANMLKETEI